MKGAVMALLQNQVHPTLWAQYSNDLADLQRRLGYQPAAAQQPAPYVQAEQALDTRTMAETVRLNAIDQAAAQRAQQHPRAVGGHAQGDSRWWYFTGGVVAVLALVIGVQWLVSNPLGSNTPSVNQPLAKGPPPYVPPQRKPLPGQQAANVPPSCTEILVNGEKMPVVNLPAGECLINQEIFASAGCPSKRIGVEDRGKSKLAPGGKRWHFVCLPSA